MITALLLMGGIGFRAGNKKIPKQFVMAGDRPIFSYAMETFAYHNMVDTVVVSTVEEWLPFTKEWSKKFKKVSGYAVGGASRQISILNGLNVASDFMNPNDIIIVHDVVRSYVKTEHITRILSAMSNNLDGIQSIVPIADAPFYVENGLIKYLPQRSKIFFGQTPACYYFGKYYQAHQNATDKELMESVCSEEFLLKMDFRIGTVFGDYENVKITTQEDLERFVYEQIKLQNYTPDVDNK